MLAIATLLIFIRSGHSKLEMAKRILIYTMSSGDGHNMISKMLKENFEKYRPGCEVIILDYYKDYPSPIRSFIGEKFYRFTMGHAHWLYYIYYNVYRHDAPPKRYPIGMWYAHLGKYRRVLRTVDEFRPDFIIGTHMFHPIGLTNLKNRGKLDVPFYSIVTDFTVYPLSEFGLGVEKIITPCEELKDGLMKLGYREDQIACLGFPVRVERPAERPNRGKGRLSLMIMAGPGRIKTIDRDLMDLLEADLDIHIDVLNGKDERHRRKIDRMISKAAPRNTVIENHGFVDDATYFEIMNGCDIMVSKCGANTLSEAIKLGKVVITSPDLVGQELENLEYFSERIPIFRIDKKVGILDILRENTFDDAFLDDYWARTDGIIPDEGYRRYVDFLYGPEEPRLLTSSLERPVTFK